MKQVVNNTSVLGTLLMRAALYRKVLFLSYEVLTDIIWAAGGLGLKCRKVATLWRERTAVGMSKIDHTVTRMQLQNLFLTFAIVSMLF